MKIETIHCLSDNYSYLIFDEKANTVSIIDPSEFSSCDRIISKYKKLDYILNTHHHSDHVDGNLKLKEKYKAKIFGFKNDKNRIPGIDFLLKDGEVSKIGNLKFKVIHVPGHTSGHIAFYFEDEKVVFTGDTLFSLGCGRVFEGTNKEMYQSLIKLKNLPINTKVFCGHEYTKKNLDFCLKYDNSNSQLVEKAKFINSKLNNSLPTIPTTIEEELKTNIFLRCDNHELKKGLGYNQASDQEIFNKLRGLKDAF